MRAAGRIRLGFYPASFIRSSSEFADFSRFPMSCRDSSIPASAMVGVRGHHERAQRCFATASSLMPTAPNRPGSGLEIVQGNTLEVHCAVESFSLLYLNPPYDWALGSGEGQSQQSHGAGLPEPHLSLVEAWRRSGARHPGTETGRM